MQHFNIIQGEVKNFSHLFLFVINTNRKEEKTKAILYLSPLYFQSLQISEFDRGYPALKDTHGPGTRARGSIIE